MKNANIEPCVPRDFMLLLLPVVSLIVVSLASDIAYFFLLSV